MDLYEILRKKTWKYFVIECVYNAEVFEMDDLFFELVDEVKNWPQVADEDGDKEDLDLENRSIVDLTPDCLTISCGGDWQEPYTFDIKAINGELTVVGELEEGFNSTDLFWRKPKKFVEHIGITTMNGLIDDDERYD